MVLSSCPSDIWPTANHIDIVQGLQDYDYMLKSHQTTRIDPFRMTGERKLDRSIFEASLGDATQPRFDSMPIRDVRKWESHMGIFVPSPIDNRYKRLGSRLGVSAIGATFLIAPMWLVMLKGGLYLALASTTVFVRRRVWDFCSFFLGRARTCPIKHCGSCGCFSGVCRAYERSKHRTKIV